MVSPMADPESENVQWLLSGLAIPIKSIYIYIWSYIRIFIIDVSIPTSIYRRFLSIQLSAVHDFHTRRESLLPLLHQGAISIPSKRFETAIIMGKNHETSWYTGWWWLEHDFYFSRNTWECHHPNWLSYFRGVETYHQPVTTIPSESWTRRIRSSKYLHAMY